MCTGTGERTGGGHSKWTRSASLSHALSAILIIPIYWTSTKSCRSKGTCNCRVMLEALLAAPTPDEEEQEEEYRGRSETHNQKDACNCTFVTEEPETKRSIIPDSKHKRRETYCVVAAEPLLLLIGVGLLPMMVTTLGCPSAPVVTTVCVTTGGAVVISWPEVKTVTLITEGKVVLCKDGEFSTR